MKKVINRKVYDTDTATEIGYWTNDVLATDFTSVTKTLYRKRNGEYFLHCEGGPMTEYASNDGLGSVGWGARIFPQSFAQAQAWAEKHIDADAYQREFGVIEDDSEVILSVRVSAAAKAALDRYVAATGRTRTDIVSELLASLTA